MRNSFKKYTIDYMQYRLSITHITTPSLDQSWLAEVISQEMLSGQDVRIVWDADGKPWLKHPPDYFISASDSGMYQAIALSRQPIGVDIECRGERAIDLLLANTDAAERAQLQVLGPDAVLAAWTAKEAVQKADSAIHDMNAYKLTVAPNDPTAFTIRRGTIHWQGIWQFEQDYICSLVIQ